MDIIFDFGADLPACIRYGTVSYLVAGRRFYVFADAVEYATGIAFGYGAVELI